MVSRLALQNKLEELNGNKNVYFQPPENLKMNYPAIKYSIDKIDGKFANDRRYISTRRYSLTVISKKPDPEIINKLLELFRATIYRQTMFAEFERDISSIIDNDGALTADKLSNMYYDLNKFYFGDGVVVDDEIRYEWERIPHFYYDFYVYKYATGLSAATAIVKGILDKKESAVENYIDFLKCGSRLSPIESLKVAGVDLNDDQVYADAFVEFENEIKQLKKYIKEVKDNG